MKNALVVGSGVSGMLSALLLSKKNQVYLVDKADEIGGLLRAFDYGAFGKFDYGMHNMLETSIPELDKMLFELLPSEEWQILEGNKRDLAGIYFQGKLQQQTPYFDLRNLNEEDYRKCVSDFFIHVNEKSKTEKTDSKFGSAKEYAYGRFGKEIAERTIIPSIEKIHKKSADELDYMATIFTPMTRVAIFDEAFTKDITLSPLLCDHIAFIDQRDLPLDRSTGRKGYYPKNYGMYRLVDAFKKELLAKNVKILTDTEVTEVNCKNDEINSITLKTSEKEFRIEDPERIVWTSGIPQLARLLKTDFTGLKNDKPLKTVIISLVIDKPLNMRDLYYFFCYDKDFNTFRLTNFSAYCEGACRNGGYPISMEFLVSEEFVLQNTSIEKIAEEELFRFGITQADTKVLFSKAEKLESGFPMPSKNNIEVLKDLRNQVKNRNLKNLLLAGILAEDNLFFQTDVLAHVYKKLNP